jgi:antitoxin Phd
VVWTLERAKNQFSEVVRRAIGDGPQEVTRGSHDAVVIISKRDYEKLVSPESLVEFLRHSPLARAVAAGTVHIDRSPDKGRRISF